MTTERVFRNLTPAMLSVLRASNETDSTLLITGSTGTGKSYLAHAVHKASLKRATHRWGKVNVATLSETLIESELFGHEKGAFTGADSRRTGRLESCNGGTVFLDEIGELPLRLQAKLLDFIQYKRISPVGSNREITLDVRIIAATNRNLEAAVSAGGFRADLYHRLNVFHVRLPDLAVNPKAVTQLARDILAARSEAAGKAITGFERDTEKLFRRYGWPGNIRELENAIEFAVALETGALVRVSSLPESLREYARKHMGTEPDHESAIDDSGADARVPSEALRLSSDRAIRYLELPMTLSYHESKTAFERTYLEHALRLCNGQINLTSRRIGLNKVSLTEKIRKYALDWRSMRELSASR